MAKNLMNSSVNMYCRGVENMNPKIIIEIIIMVLRLIAEGCSKSKAIAQAASAFGVSRDFVRRLVD